MPAASAIWSIVAPRKPCCENTSSAASRMISRFSVWMRVRRFRLHRLHGPSFEIAACAASRFLDQSCWTSLRTEARGARGSAGSSCASNPLTAHDGGANVCPIGQNLRSTAAPEEPSVGRPTRGIQKKERLGHVQQAQRRAERPQRVLDAVHGKPPVQAGAAHAGRRRRTCTTPPSDGRKVLDGTAGLWCVNAGHCRPKITEAIQRQAAELDYAPAFQMGHPIVFELANRLVDVAPRGHGPCVLHQFRVGIGRHRAQDRAGLPAGEGRG
jgi:hypothetical protein